MLTQVGVLEQGSYEYEKYHEKSKRTALMLASSKGMKGIVEKLLAAGARAETTNEVHSAREERVAGG